MNLLAFRRWSDSFGIPYKPLDNYGCYIKDECSEILSFCDCAFLTQEQKRLPALTFCYHKRNSATKAQKSTLQNHHRLAFPFVLICWRTSAEIWTHVGNLRSCIWVSGIGPPILIPCKKRSKLFFRMKKNCTALYVNDGSVNAWTISLKILLARKMLWERILKKSNTANSVSHANTTSVYVTICKPSELNI